MCGCSQPFSKIYDPPGAAKTHTFPVSSGMSPSLCHTYWAIHSGGSGHHFSPNAGSKRSWLTALENKPRQNECEKNASPSALPLWSKSMQRQPGQAMCPTQVRAGPTRSKLCARIVHTSVPANTASIDKKTNRDGQKHPRSNLCLPKLSWPARKAGNTATSSLAVGLLANMLFLSC